MPAQVPEIPTMPAYTVLSSTFSTVKSVSTAGKNYKIISSVESLAEAVAEKALTVTSKYTAVSSLKEVDAKLRPVLVDLDRAVSPYVATGIEKGQEGGKKLEPVLNVARKVLPVKTAETVAYAVYGIFIKNLESVGKALLITNPETSNN
jgi:hypothetical protein